MTFTNHRGRHSSFLSLKLWLFFLACQLLRQPEICWALEVADEQGLRQNNHDSNGSNHTPETDTNSTEIEPQPQTTDNESCRYSKTNRRLVCQGSINYAYLKEIEDEISLFVVEGYERKSLFKSKWSSSSIQTGEWYLNMPKLYQKLSGQIQLEDSELEVNVDLRLLPQKDLKGFYVEGEAFSNKILKISWALRGKLWLDFVRNRTIINLDLGAGGESRWKVHSNLTFLWRDEESEADGWKARGCIESEDGSESQLVFYGGTVWTKVGKEECKFLGEMQVQNVNLGVSLNGKISPPQQRQITIPKSAFSNMTIRNMIFKDSNFYNDFDRNSFQGLLGLKSITFTESKMEMLPRLDELFQGFTELEEIYIEDCDAPRLKFGSLSVLRNVRKVSFKGSGPLIFDDATFIWLKNSNLTFLNLRNSNIKISVKGNSVFWSVKDTLKHLDISYSTVNGEKEFALVLNDLSIVTLMAEGLKLRKVPTAGLSSVRKTLKFLSLRGNAFRKNFEKQMFDCILNFPMMLNLRELNLEECHINYIERGAFDNLPNLKVLHLGFNNLENVQDGWTNIRPQVTYLSLRHNGVSPQVSSLGLFEMGATANLSKFEQLETLDLSDGIFANVNKIIGGLGRGLRNLSLRNTGLEELPENVFENLTDLETLDLSHNRNIKTGQPFSFALFKSMKKLNWLNLNHCRISGASYQGDSETNNSDYLILENLQSLDLSVNNFKVLDSKMLRAFPKLKILNLSGNSITEWSTVMVFNDDLDAVFLDENKIETITPEMVSSIKKLKQVKLGNNPFICGPYVYDIMKIITEGNENQVYLPDEVDSDVNEFNDEKHFGVESHPFVRKLLPQIFTNKGNVRFLDWSERNYVCFSWLQAKFIPFNQLDEDFHELRPDKEKNEEIALLWVTAIVVIGVVLTIAVTCWKFLDIHLITRAVRSAVALTFISRGEKTPTDFRYNVFVSYCDKDRPWVVENLLPRLESMSDVKVCLHERDFQVGLSIIENILHSIDSSRNIILVLSQAFLKSQWCQYEMQLAQFRLLEKGHDQLLLIFLENIPAVRRPKALKYLMMTKTYIQWPLNPKNSREVDTFWNRLMNSIIIKD